jgi:hypothetical protein
MYLKCIRSRYFATVNTCLDPRPPPPLVRSLLVLHAGDGQVLPIIIKNLVWPEKPSGAASAHVELEVRWCMMSTTTLAR